MRKAITAVSAALALSIGLAAPGMAERQDAKGSQDPALFTRMPNFKIYQYVDKQFDAYGFRVAASGKQTTQSVEGHLVYWKYVFDKSSGASSPASSRSSGTTRRQRRSWEARSCTRTPM